MAKSNYRARLKSAKGRKRKKVGGDCNRTWLKTRRRVRRSLARQQP